MKQRLFFGIIFCLLSSITNCYGQSLRRIKSLILRADSVILTSHICPFPIKTKEDKNNWELVLGNRINPQFIKEQKKLTDLSRKYLANFITQPFKDSILEKGMCFMPHHTVYIFTMTRISWIDICFLCGEIETSADIKFPQKDFDSLTWKKLKIFFKAEGIKYGYRTKDP
jgi:hypothetical protein